jgi:hypothetical protein
MARISTSDEASKRALSAWKLFKEWFTNASKIMQILFEAALIQLERKRLLQDMGTTLAYSKDKNNAYLKNRLDKLDETLSALDRKLEILIHTEDIKGTL